MADTLDDDWNSDVEEDIGDLDLSSLIVYSRDWTVETIVTQIRKGNIDLNPKFQRRNAWTDARRSRLIESLIINVPIPEIVLAENAEQRNSFLVIDGKQRLLTIAGFVDPDEYEYWKKPQLSDLKVCKKLNGRSYFDIQSSSRFEDIQRQLVNSDIRCTIIGNYDSTDVLYDIFYRLNTGSVPLSTQELRQVLIKGSFADYLVEVTNEPAPIHKVLGIDGPDKRLRDVELVVRFISFSLFSTRYTGNLKDFLDRSMSAVTKGWDEYESRIEKEYDRLNSAIDRMKKFFPTERIGRRLGVNGKWEARFNKVLFEVEAYYFSRMPARLQIDERTKKTFLKRFSDLCANDDFRSSIEATTKSLEKYEIRYGLFGEFINSSLNLNIKPLPLSK